MDRFSLWAKAGYWPHRHPGPLADDQPRPLWIATRTPGGVPHVRPSDAASLDSILSPALARAHARALLDAADVLEGMLGYDR